MNDEVVEVKTVADTHTLISSGINPPSSIIVDDENCELFDEIDELYPHGHEGGKIVSDPQKSSTSNNSSSLSEDYFGERDSRRSTLTTSLLQSLQSSQNSKWPIPTDYDSLVASWNDGTLNDIIAGIEDRYEASTTMSVASKLQRMDENGDIKKNVSKRESIVGGKEISAMSFEEQRELLAPDLLVDIEGSNSTEMKRSDVKYTQLSRGQDKHHDMSYYSPTITPNEKDSKNIIVSSVDWSSLSKSCKRAKNAFRDIDSGQMVVKNMFLTHLSALTTVLTLYAKRYCDTNSRKGSIACTVDEIKAGTIETKRALRFAIACLTPPLVEDEVGGAGEDTTAHKNETQDENVEKYRIVRHNRQELQEAAVKGSASSRPSSLANGAERNEGRESHHFHGLQIPLVEIINADSSAALSALDDDDAKRAVKVISIDREKRNVRVLAARMLCNIVTDNPLAAEVVLRDVPFSPSPSQALSRMAGAFFGEQADNVSTDGDDMIFWSDLVDVTAKVQAGDGGNKGEGKHDDQDREALAAVSAAFHNLITSLEAQESLIELDDEMERREFAKHRREAPFTGIISETEAENEPTKLIDVGFAVATNGPLLNAFLRNILPVKAVLLQSQLEREETDKSRPKFKPPVSTAENMSDAATEWISLVLERLASRGLLPQMLRSVGGSKSKSVTPEQVVLVSCIRQAVDAYHSALGETAEFQRRRLSNAANSAGMSVQARPHPLWGRADMIVGGKVTPSRDSRTAVPVLTSLAHEAEDIRLRVNSIREGDSIELYDGEENCSIRIIDDLCDIVAQSLGRHASTSPYESDNEENRQCFIADARSVLGRETTIISSCCKDLGRILDTALANNSGRKAREMALSSQEQQTAIVMVRLIGNIVFQCCYNQDLLRITLVPVLDIAMDSSTSASTAGAGDSSNVGPIGRTGLHVVLSATALAPACFTLREWCIVAIRNAVEDNAANIETVRRLEAKQVLDDTPELRQMGVKIDMDAQGKVQVKRRDEC